MCCCHMNCTIRIHIPCYQHIRGIIFYSLQNNHLLISFAELMLAFEYCWIFCSSGNDLSPHFLPVIYIISQM